METVNTEFFLFAAIFSTIVLAAFTLAANYTIVFLKDLDASQETPENRGFDNTMPELLRRKTVWKPTITCSLPMREEKRPEAPFFLK